MILEGYDVFDDPYAYPGSSVLQNRLNIRDSALLEAFEIEMSSLRAEEALPQGSFDAAHYRSIHRHLFQDIYEWAGQYRHVRTSKAGHVFCYPEHIELQMNELFGMLPQPIALQHMALGEFIKTLARFLAELNAIHPFREGNGRSQLVFLGLLAARSGRPLDFTRLDRHSFLNAMVTSFSKQTGLLEAELAQLLVSQEFS